MNKYRWDGESVTVGPFTAKVDFMPDGIPHAVFLMSRGKAGHELDDILYELSTKISRIMQGKP